MRAAFVPSDTAIRLRRFYHRHDHIDYPAVLALANSIASAFGWRSPVGRIWETHLRNSKLGYALENVLTHLDPPTWDQERKLLPTPVAMRMIQNSHDRPTWRCVPMPGDTFIAIMAYIEERLAIYDEVLDELNSVPANDTITWLSQQLALERKYWDRVKQLLLTSRG